MNAQTHTRGHTHPPSHIHIRGCMHANSRIRNHRHTHTQSLCSCRERDWTAGNGITHPIYQGSVREKKRERGERAREIQTHRKVDTHQATARRRRSPAVSQARAPMALPTLAATPSTRKLNSTQEVLTLVPTAANAACAALPPLRPSRPVCSARVAGAATG
jgi:hypothetical protein